MIADIQRVKIKESKLSTTEDYHITKANEGRKGTEDLQTTTKKENGIAHFLRVNNHLKYYKQENGIGKSLSINDHLEYYKQQENEKIALIIPSLLVVTLDIPNNKKIRKWYWSFLINNRLEYYKTTRKENDTGPSLFINNHLEYYKQENKRTALVIPYLSITLPTTRK